MTEVVTENAALEGEYRFTADEQVKVERIKGLLRQEMQTQWEIGDLVLAICGPPGSPAGMGRLRALAAELNVSDQLLARYRVTSAQFPRHKRTWDLPHSAYQQVQAYPAIADAVLTHVAKNPRAYSDTLLKETKERFLGEAGMLSRTPPRLTKAERFVNAIVTFRERASYGDIQLTRSEALSILRAWEDAEPYIRQAARVPSARASQSGSAE